MNGQIEWPTTGIGPKTEAFGGCSTSPGEGWYFASYFRTWLRAMRWAVRIWCDHPGSVRVMRMEKPHPYDDTYNWAGWWKVSSPDSLFAKLHRATISRAYGAYVRWYYRRWYKDIAA